MEFSAMDNLELLADFACIYLAVISRVSSTMYAYSLRRIEDIVWPKSGSSVNALLVELLGRPINDFREDIVFLPNVYRNSPDSAEFGRIRNAFLKKESVGLYPIVSARNCSNCAKSKLELPLVAYLMDIMVNYNAKMDLHHVALLCVDMLLMYCFGLENTGRLVNPRLSERQNILDEITKTLSPTFQSNIPPDVLRALAIVRLWLFCQMDCEEEVNVQCMKYLFANQKPPFIGLPPSVLPVHPWLASIRDYLIELSRTNNKDHRLSCVNYMKDQLRFDGCARIPAELWLCFLTLKLQLFSDKPEIRLKSREIIEKYSIEIDVSDIISFGIDGLRFSNQNIANLESLVLITGATGSGKSTLTNYLCGTRYKRTRDIVSKMFYLETHASDVMQSVCPIGHGFKSKTLYPLLVPVLTGAENKKIGLVDCPGSHDSRDGALKLAADLGVPVAISYAGDASAMIVVVEETATYFERGDHLRKIFQHIANIFHNPKAFFESMASLTLCPIIFVITKISLEDAMENPNDLRAGIFHRFLALLNNRDESEAKLRNIHDIIARLKGEVNELCMQINDMEENVDCDEQKLAELKERKDQKIAELKYYIAEEENILGEEVVLRMICLNEENLFIIRAYEAATCPDDHKKELLDRLFKLSASGAKIKKHLFKFTTCCNSFYNTEVAISSLSTTIVEPSLIFARSHYTLEKLGTQIRQQEDIIANCENELKSLLSNNARGKLLVEASIRTIEDSVEFSQDYIKRKLTGKDSILKERANLENLPNAEYRCLVRTTEVTHMGQLLGLNYLFRAQLEFEIDDGIPIEYIELSSVISPSDDNAIVVKTPIANKSPLLRQCTRTQFMVIEDSNTQLALPVLDKQIVTVEAAAGSEGGKSVIHTGKFVVSRNQLQNGYAKIKYVMHRGSSNKSCVFRAFVKERNLPANREKLICWRNQIETLDNELELEHERVLSQQAIINVDRRYLEQLRSAAGMRLNASDVARYQCPDEMHTVVRRIENLLNQLGKRGQLILRSSFGLDKCNEMAKKMILSDDDCTNKLIGLAVIYNDIADLVRPVTGFLTREDYLKRLYGYSNRSDGLASNNHAVNAEAVLAYVTPELFRILNDIYAESAIPFVCAISLLRYKASFSTLYDELEQLKLKFVLHKLLVMESEAKLKAQKHRFLPYEFLYSICYGNDSEHIPENAVAATHSEFMFGPAGLNQESAANLFCGPESWFVKNEVSFIESQDFEHFSALAATVHRVWGEADGGTKLAKYVRSVMKENHIKELSFLGRALSYRLAERSWLEETKMDFVLQDLKEFIAGVSWVSEFIADSNEKTTASQYLVIGNAGVGKSCFINCLCGVNYVLQYSSSFKTNYLRPVSHEFISTKVGSHYNASKTLLPKSAHVSKDSHDVLYIDTPGLCHMERSKVSSLIAEFALVNLASKLKRLCKILFVLDWSMLENRSNLSGFQQLCYGFIDLFREEMETDFVNIVFTKVPTDVNVENIVYVIEAIKCSLERNSNINDDRSTYDEDMIECTMKIVDYVLEKPEWVILFHTNGSITNFASLHIVNSSNGVSTSGVRHPSHANASNCKHFISVACEYYVRQLQYRREYTALHKFYTERCHSLSGKIRSLNTQLKCLLEIEKNLANIKSSRGSKKFGDSSWARNLNKNLARFGIVEQLLEYENDTASNQSKIKILEKICQEVEHYRQKALDSFDRENNLLSEAIAKLENLSNSVEEVRYAEEKFRFYYFAPVYNAVGNSIVAAGSMAVGATISAVCSPIVGAPVGKAIYDALGSQVQRVVKYITAKTIKYQCEKDVPIVRIDKKGLYGTFASDSFDYIESTNTYKIKYFPFSQNEFNSSNGETSSESPADEVFLQVWVHRKDLCSTRLEIAELKLEIHSRKKQVEFYRNLLRQTERCLLELRGIVQAVEWPVKCMANDIRSHVKSLALSQLNMWKYQKLVQLQHTKFDALYRSWVAIAVEKLLEVTSGVVCKPLILMTELSKDTAKMSF